MLPGVYDLDVMAEGYDTLRVENFRVESEGRTKLELTLSRPVAISVGDLPHSSVLDIKLFPNPVRNLLWLKWSAPKAANAPLCELYDISGRMIWHGTIGRLGDWSIDCSALAPGIYFLRISSSDHRRICKFVKY